MKLQKDNYELAYHHSSGESPCVMFCGGFNSNMQGNKALALEAFCRERSLAYLRFDYSGHGESGGEFADGCISVWLEDTLAMIDQIVEGDLILVGSSMGGWISLLAALQRHNRVKGLLLIACAADMTNYYQKRLLGLPAQSDAKGRLYYSVANQYDNEEPYSIYQRLLDDGPTHYLLNEMIELEMPVRLVHGMEDGVVDWRRSEQVMTQLVSKDVSLLLRKHGDHRLSNDEDLAVVQSMLSELLSAIGSAE